MRASVSAPRAFVAQAEGCGWPWNGRNRAYVFVAMLHWAISFGLMALIAAVFALADLPLAVRAAAQILFWLNVALFALSLLTGLFGRGRDGLYSAERAVAWTGGAAALLALGAVWLQHDWSAAGSALDQVAAMLPRD